MSHFAIVTAFGLLLSACGSPSPGERTSEVEVAFTSALRQGSCLRITLDGQHRDVRSFDITATSDDSFLLGNIPVSTLKVWADTYPTACSRAPEGSAASWFSESVSVTVRPGITARTALSLLHNDQPPNSAPGSI